MALSFWTVRRKGGERGPEAEVDTAVLDAVARREKRTRERKEKERERRAVEEAMEVTEEEMEMAACSSTWGGRRGHFRGAGRRGRGAVVGDEQGRRRRRAGEGEEPVAGSGGVLRLEAREEPRRRREEAGGGKMWCASCLASACAGCACNLCTSAASSVTRRSARLAYCGLFAASLILSFLYLHWLPLWIGSAVVTS